MNWYKLSQLNIDTLSDNGLEPKDVTGEISKLARNWFLLKWNKLKENE
jgi:uncharacterized protein YjiS (DUF1127 family)